MTVKTRFAPSPTGYLHIGGVRTALFSWLYARHHGGQFVLRIEDTDKARSTEEAIQVILDGMEWLGLEADEGPFYQTHRMERYQAVLDQLLESGQAYPCYCSKERIEALRAEQMARKEKPRYDGRCRNGAEPQAGVEPVFRFKTPPDGEVAVEDAIKGRVVFDNRELDDLVIARADRTPTYNFSVVVDDADMGITHVIRGDDHLNNTPRQIHMLRVLQVEPPRYAHLPLIRAADGAKLSKRHGAVSVLEFRQEGYLPDTLLNYLVRLGWSHGDQEVFTLEEMIELFDIDDVNKSASAFNPEKLAWLNQQYIMQADTVRLARELQWQLECMGVDTSQGPSMEALAEVQRERAKTTREMALESLMFFQDVHEYHEKAALKHLKLDALEPLRLVQEGLTTLEPWEREPIHGVVHGVAEKLELKLGKVAQPIRVAVSGGPVSPAIDATLELLGREKTLARLERAMIHVQQHGEG